MRVKQDPEKISGLENIGRTAFCMTAVGGGAIYSAM
jgi:hypothetical protein